LSISEVMISLVEKNARSTPGIAASSAPPAAPAAIIARMTIGDGAPASSNAIVAPVIAPA
jgi:hypothetical protein